MKKGLIFLGFLLLHSASAAPEFRTIPPNFHGTYEFNAAALCNTAQETLAYLNKGSGYDPEVIHDGVALKIPLTRVKATLTFICKHQMQLNDPAFIKEHFEFIRWYPDVSRAQQLSTHKILLQNLPKDRILMTKYFVHLAKASLKPTADKPFALYALPADEQQLTLEEANAKPGLTRFKYGKQAILHGALANKPVPTLAYFNRDDFETALLQGTVVADLGSAGRKILNVHRNNNIAYDRTKSPYEQERFWYFKPVTGIKGYGKDAEHKITVNPEVTFAADLTQLGLGKMLMVQYPDKFGHMVSRAGILADTGGAFADNLYQVDYLAGSFAGQTGYIKGTRHLPDYVSAYFMVVKTKYQ